LVRRPILVCLLVTAPSLACLVSVDESLLDAVSETDAANPIDGALDHPPDGSTSDAQDSGLVPGAKCPTGRGSPMVLVGDFCIDERETTIFDYRAFLGSGVDAGAGRPAECAFKTSHSPDDWPAPRADDPLPVNRVDWCDAWAYCAWSGKRLCGGTGGAALTFASVTDSTDEWHRACTNERKTQFPFGASFDVRVCNVVGYQTPTKLLPPGSATACHGTASPFASITDLVGNVAEWQRSCESNSGVDAGEDSCRLRGASWYTVSEDGCNDLNFYPRGARSPATGIRCCADPR
jgi:formylglycine-generating enzyme required for sulfatase activity